jgi:hypothetical protein
MELRVLAVASPPFIFSSRQVRQRQPADCASAGIGRCGSSKHQQPPSGWQVIAEPHLAQMVCIKKLWDYPACR